MYKCFAKRGCRDVYNKSKREGSCGIVTTTHVHYLRVYITLRASPTISDICVPSDTCVATHIYSFVPFVQSSSVCKL